MAAYQYVYVMKDLTKAYPGGREVFKGITLSFLPGVKIGVLGVNGAGKSTLLKLMVGDLEPLDGMVKRHNHLKIAQYHQHLTELLDPDATPLEWMVSGCRVCSRFLRDCLVWQSSRQSMLLWIDWNLTWPLP